MKKTLVSCFIAFTACVNLYAQNTESKMPGYTLPDVLKTSDGQVVKTKAQWEQKRRPEIVKLFEDNVYGQMPKKYDSINYKVTNDVPDAMGGKAHLKEVAITVHNNNKEVLIHLALYIPNNHKGPAPAFLSIDYRGKSVLDPIRDTNSGFWPAEMAIEHGYAMAIFFVSDVAPDNNDDYKNGALQLYPNQLIADNGMKAIGSWAWAESRVMDYFETDKDIDSKKVAICGHSRCGKTALWAAAQDQRFAMVFANCSGNTGAALARHKGGETIKQINTRFPYWFNNNYKKYNDNENALPIDQHMLIALIAPRPVYTTNATKDEWADPIGSYLSIQNAEPVYALYGKKSLLTPQPPPVGTAITNSIMGYHIRDGIHDLTAFDWENVIKFADFNYYHKVSQ
jgi:hypothetical protein